MRKVQPLSALIYAIALGAAGFVFYRGEMRKATVLEKIMALEIPLEANNRQDNSAAVAAVRGISVAVFENRNQAQDVLVLKQSQQILSRSRTIADTLQTIQQQLRAAANEDSIGAIRHPDAIPKRPAGSVIQLAKHLDRFTRFIRQYVPNASSLAQLDHDGTTWLYTNYSYLGPALVSLTRLKAEVRRQTAEALRAQAQKVGTKCICFDKIGAIAVANSNTVAPGSLYEAQLFITQAASSYHPKLTANGKTVFLQPSGMGLVEIQVPPLQPNQPDTIRAWWRGTIQTHTYLADTTWQLNTPYFIVRKPAL